MRKATVGWKFCQILREECGFNVYWIDASNCKVFSADSCKEPDTLFARYEEVTKQM